MNSINSLRDSLNAILGMPPHIRSQHLPALAPLLSREATVRLIDDVLADEATLTEIAARSYTHTLGFRKITLLHPVFHLPDGGKCEYLVRLHIWQPDSKLTVPLVEAKHEHSFDFISRMLIGEMENQCYTMHALNEEESALLTRVCERVAQLNDEQRAFANLSVQALEALQMANLGSQQAEIEALQVDRVALGNLLAISDAEIDVLVALQGRFEYDAAASKFGGNYVHSMTGSVSLRPAAVLKLREGDLYHHGASFIHRLYMRAQQANATIIVSTPVKDGAEGASFQHPTWFDGSNVGYQRSMYSPQELRAVLQKFRDELAAMPSCDSERQLDVALAVKS